MIDLLNALLIGFVVLISLPAVILSVEILAALLPGKKDNLPENSRRPSIAILIPAHDEASVIASTLSALKAQLRENDRLLVVADNCTDNTAEIARGLGAEVIERLDAENCGKGFALDFGIRHLEKNPPEVVIVIDADCLVGKGAVEVLALHALARNRPVQALNLMCLPPDASWERKIAEFAWIIKCLARPLGLKRMGLPCQLMGTGMAFPWPVLANSDLASGHIVEDLKLGLDLAEEGFPPFFLPDAQVSSTFPSNPEAVESQRTRWEHGHLNVLFSRLPSQIFGALKARNVPFLSLAIDAAVPPLAFYVLFAVLGLVLTGIVAVFIGSTNSFWVILLSLGLLTFSLLVAWRKFAKEIIPMKTVVAIPLYVLKKVPIYFRFFVRRQTGWVRTSRDNQARGSTRDERN